MSFIDVALTRRPRRVQPRFEVLEERECPAVAAPPTLTLTALSPSQVKMTWSNVVGETGYRVYRWDGTQPVLIGQVGVNVTTFTVSNLPPNQTQWLTVEAFDLTTTAQTAWKSITLPPDAITTPGNFRVASTNLTQVTLTWTFAKGAQGYRVYGWDGARSVLLGTVGPSVNSFVATNLLPGTTYSFRVEAFNATNSISTPWLAAQTRATSITAPGNPAATAISTNKLGLSWADSVGETGYRVYVWTGNPAAQPALMATLKANTTGYQAVALLPGKTYWFYIQAFNTVSTANSLWVQGTTLTALPLQPPTTVVATAADATSATVTWTEPARAVGYRVYVWTGTYWALTKTVSAGTHSVTITGLPPNTTHWFMVQAFTDNFAEVSYSSAVSVNL